MTEDRPRILAITACPTGIAHTYMAAEKLTEAAEELGCAIEVETHGSIGVENAFSQADLDNADAVVVAADKKIDLSRFAGKPLVTARVAAGINEPSELIRRALEAAPYEGDPGQSSDEHSASAPARQGSIGAEVYKALMNGVSHMIPFVVAGGLLIAVALSIGGTPTEAGLVIEPGTFWDKVSQIGGLSFSLMVPILSGYIAYSIADRPGLAPGMIAGFIATTGSLYDAETGAGFIGGIITGFMAGYLALALKKIPVHKYVKPIMPIIVIPVVTTVVVGLVFVYLLGGPIAAVFTGLTQFLEGMQGASTIVLGLILGAMIGFDMGGPVNKTAFLFAGGLIATGNAEPMGMVAAAIAVPPLGMGLATLVRRSAFTSQEHDVGIAALFMGFFGITEGAIPFAAARPVQVIPANIAGAAVAGAVAGVFGVADQVMHGGPIVAVLGAVANPLSFFIAIVIGTMVTAAVALALIGLAGDGTQDPPVATATPMAVPGDPATTSSTVGSGGVATDNGSALPRQDTAATAHEPVAAAAGNVVVADTAPSRETVASTPSDPGADPGADPEADPGADPGADPEADPGADHGAREMSVRSYLSRETVTLAPSATNRDELIRELVAMGVATGQVDDADEVVASALAREAQSSTAVGHGIAIPHAKSSGAVTPMVAFARATPGITWGDDGDDPAQFVFLISVPTEAAGNEHLKILSSLARALAKEPFREALAAATSPDDVVDLTAAHVEQR